MGPSKRRNQASRLLRVVRVPSERSFVDGLGESVGLRVLLLVGDDGDGDGCGATSAQRVAELVAAGFDLDRSHSNQLGVSNTKRAHYCLGFVQDGHGNSCDQQRASCPSSKRTLEVTSAAIGDKRALSSIIIGLEEDEQDHTASGIGPTNSDDFIVINGVEFVCACMVVEK